MTSTSKRSAIGSSRDELQLPNAVQPHQLDAIRDPSVPIQTLTESATIIALPLRARMRRPTPSKLLNDALRPAN